MDRPEFFFFFSKSKRSLRLNGIVSKETKFVYVVSQLEPKHVENIWGIITSNSATRYSESKTRLLDLFKESERSQIKKLITGNDLGNLKPNQLLKKLKFGNRCVTRRHTI